MKAADDTTTKVYHKLRKKYEGVIIITDAGDVYNLCTNFSSKQFKTAMNKVLKNIKQVGR